MVADKIELFIVNKLQTCRGKTEAILISYVKVTLYTRFLEGFFYECKCFLN